MCSFLGTSGGESLPGSSTLYRCVSGRNPEAIDDAEGVSGAFICCSAAKESGHPTPASKIAAGFRMPLAEPGVRLSLRTGLSLDVYA